MWGAGKRQTGGARVFFCAPLSLSPSVCVRGTRPASAADGRCGNTDRRLGWERVFVTSKLLAYRILGIGMALIHTLRKLRPHHCSTTPLSGATGPGWGLGRKVDAAVAVGCESQKGIRALAPEQGEGGGRGGGWREGWRRAWYPLHHPHLGTWRGARKGDSFVAAAAKRDRRTEARYHLGWRQRGAPGVGFFPSDEQRTPLGALTKEEGMSSTKIALFFLVRPGALCAPVEDMHKGSLACLHLPDTGEAWLGMSRRSSPPG